jgi:hypothetical protein
MLHFKLFSRTILKLTIWIVAFFSLLCAVAHAAPDPHGGVAGVVINTETQQPLVGVNVMLANTPLGAATNEKGEYVISNVPVGSYNLVFHFIGYEKVTKTDVIIRSGRNTSINAKLQQTVLEADELIVSAGYFQKEDSEPISVTHFNAEEVRRSPGSVGDISRMLTALPSTAQVSDNANDLAVRGGSPFENSFYVDGIQVPNINHFPTQGATGGPIGMLNVDFIENVTFYSGGFSAAYGDRLSSVVDISFRDGNRDHFQGQANVDFSGFGGVVEGPIDDNGSFFLSARQSYLDFIVELIGETTAPRYGDVHAKIKYDVGDRHQFTVLNLFGDSRSAINKTQAKKNGEGYYGLYDGYQNTVGASWRYLWSKNGYSKTVLSHSIHTSEDSWTNIKTDEYLSFYQPTESWLRLRNTTFYKFNVAHKIELGFDLARETADYNYDVNEYTNRLGQIVPVVQEQHTFDAMKSGLFLNYIWRPVAQLTTTVGLRGDYFSFNNNVNLSPRVSATFRASSRLTLNASVGQFYQNLPAIIVSQNQNYKNLADPQCRHIVLGMDYMLTENAILTVEVYDKQYSNFPLEPDDPWLFVIDDGRFGSFFRIYSGLEDHGRAYSRGLELMVQKKLAADFYGLLSASIFNSRYEDYNGVWRDRLYDNKFVFCVIGGYKPNNKWEVSVRWNYAGGIPYTPFDVEKSTEMNTGVIDHSRIFAERRPDYHSLNLRVDRRFNFNNSGIVTYLSLWNAYNRKNVLSEYWDTYNNQLATYYQWSLIPIFGLEYEF